MPPNQAYNLVTVLVDNGYYVLTPPFQIIMAIPLELQTPITVCGDYVLSQVQVICFAYWHVQQVLLF